MDVSRKNFTTEQLIEKEKEIIEQIKEIKEKYDGVFAGLGCEIEAEYVKRGEYDDEFSDIDFAPENYVNGYVSRANFVIKKIKTDDSAPDADYVPEEGETTEETAAARQALVAQDELERTVAYTEIMIMRIYKSFWVEKVTLCEKVSPIDDDLSEFAEKLKEEER